MERLVQYGLIIFLEESMKTGHRVKLHTEGSVSVGAVKYLDKQGPFASVFIQEPDQTNGVGVMLNHITLFRMAPDQSDPEAFEDEFDRMTRMEGTSD